MCEKKRFNLFLKKYIFFFFHIRKIKRRQKEQKEWQKDNNSLYFYNCIQS